MFSSGSGAYANTNTMDYKRNPSLLKGMYSISNEVQKLSNPNYNQRMEKLMSRRQRSSEHRSVSSMRDGTVGTTAGFFARARPGALTCCTLIASTPGTRENQT